MMYGQAAPRLPAQTAGQSVSFADAVGLWLDAKRGSGWADETYRKVSTMKETWLYFLGGKQLAEIAPLDLQRIFLFLKGKGRSAWWLNDVRKCLRSFWIYALRLGYVGHEVFSPDSWPVLKARAVHPEIQFTEAQEEAFCLALPERWRRPVEAYVRLVLRTALRRRAVYGLRCSMVSSDWWLTPEVALIKNENPVRFPLGLFPSAVKALSPLGPPDSPLIPGLPDKSYINRVLQATARKIGMPSASIFKTTELRRIAVDRYLARDPNPDRCRMFYGWLSLKVMDLNYRFQLSDQRRVDLARGLLPSPPPTV